MMCMVCGVCRVVCGVCYAVIGAWHVVCRVWCLMGGGRRVVRCASCVVCCLQRAVCSV